MLSGCVNPTWQAHKLVGTFDGRGHIIKDVSFGRFSATYGQGSFFGRINGTLKNVAFVDMLQIQGNGNGYLARYAENATIENVYVSGTTSSYADVAISSGDGIITAITGATTMTNVVFNVAYTLDVKQPILNLEGESGRLTKTNVFALTSNPYIYNTDSTGVYASALPQFFMAASVMKGGLLYVQNFCLYFNDVQIL